MEQTTIYERNFMDIEVEQVFLTEGGKTHSRKLICK